MAGGQLLEWNGERAIARGLDDIAYGDVVSIDGAGQAIVCGLHDGYIELAPLTTRVPASDAGVRRIGPHLIPAGTSLVGRALDVTGEPTDARGPLRCDTLHRVFGRDPVLLPEVRRRRLTFGLLCLDLQTNHALGMSFMAHGPRDVTLHVMSHQHAVDRICIVATPRVTRRQYQAYRRPALPCIHVAPTDDASSVQQWLVPWTAIAIADGLRAQGHDVVVVIDDIDGWKPHVRYGLPRGGYSTQLAHMGSRAYALEKGSVTIIARAVELSPAIAAAFDTSLDLDNAVYGRGKFTKYVQPPIKVPAPNLFGRLMMDAAQLIEIERRVPWVRALPKVDLATKAMLANGTKAREILRYREGMTLDCVEQLACALAAQHVLDLHAEAVGAFFDAYLLALRKEHGARLDEIRRARAMTPDDQTAWLALAVTVATPFLLS